MRKYFTLWSLVSTDIHIREWADDELCVAYNPLSGDTHLIEQVGVELLKLLATGPHTTDHLVSVLAETFAPDQHSQLLEFVSTTLLQLKDAGLVSDVSR